MHAFSCHMLMHTCSSRGGGGRVRGGCGATGAPEASPAAGVKLTGLTGGVRQAWNSSVV